MTSTAPARSPTPSNRARGEIRASFTRTGRTQIERVYEAGGLRLRFPKVVPGFTPDCEAVCINTAGGMVGGDAADLAFRCGENAAVTVTTQSAEKIYRSEGTTTRVSVTLDLAAGARLEWLPQDTILFDRIDLARRIEADMAGSASLLLAESLVFGRLAMGETVRAGAVHDRWRIRRDGRLVFAEDFRVGGDVQALLDRPALVGGARALAILLYVSPDAESQIDTVRAALAQGPAEAGASAWNGLLTVRLASHSPDHLRASMVTLLRTLRGQSAPRVWQ